MCHELLSVVTQGTLFLFIIGFNLAQEIITGETAQAQIEVVCRT
tara:strand:+ start:658 stop:789 length:132 start_codon:yes stop_codon:yes gene_type:complete